MPKYEKLVPSVNGDTIIIEKGKLSVPDHPVIPFIQGDGTGPDIWRASQPVLDEAVKKAYKGKRKIQWFEIHAGLSALKLYGNDRVLPEDTLMAIEEYIVWIKGSLTPPVGRTQC